MSQFHLYTKIFLQKCFLQKIQIFSLIGNQNSEDIFQFGFLIKTNLYIL